jgi:membrane protein implicated in regulation of membrane protease activity
MGLLTIVRVHVNCQIAALLMSAVPGLGLFGFLFWVKDGAAQAMIMFLIFALFVAGQVISFSIAARVLDKMDENRKQIEASSRETLTLRGNTLVAETKKEVLTWR